MENLELLYGSFVICKCNNRTMFLKDYHETFVDDSDKLETPQPLSTVYDCRDCQWNRFEKDTTATFRIDSTQRTQRK
jgi:hypothetical protein